MFFLFFNAVLFHIISKCFVPNYSMTGGRGVVGVGEESIR